MFFFIILFLNILCVAHQLTAVEGGGNDESRNTNKVEPISKPKKYVKRSAFGSRYFLFHPYQRTFPNTQEVKNSEHTDPSTPSAEVDVKPSMVEMNENTTCSEAVKSKTSEKEKYKNPRLLGSASLDMGYVNKKKIKKEPCPECGKKFGVVYLRQEHLPSHSATYKCYHCKDTFASSITLKRHEPRCPLKD